MAERAEMIDIDTPKGRKLWEAIKRWQDQGPSAKEYAVDRLVTVLRGLAQYNYRDRAVAAAVELLRAADCNNDDVCDHENVTTLGNDSTGRRVMWCRLCGSHRLYDPNDVERSSIWFGPFGKLGVVEEE